MALPLGDQPMLVPIGEGVNNMIIRKEQVEKYLNSTLAPAQM